MSKYEVNKELVLSTCHLPECVAKMMDDGDQSVGFVYYKFMFGYMVCVNPSKYPAEMMPHIDKAKELGCLWLVYDCDGMVYDEFKTYEW
jgi:hypothetical protein